MKVIDRVKLLHKNTEVEIVDDTSYVLIFRGYADEVMADQELQNLNVTRWDIRNGEYIFEVE